LKKEEVKQTKYSCILELKLEERAEYNVASMMGCFSLLLSGLLRAIDRHLTGFFERLLMALKTSAEVQIKSTPNCLDTRVSMSQSFTDLVVLVNGLKSLPDYSGGFIFKGG